MNKPEPPASLSVPPIGPILILLGLTAAVAWLRLQPQRTPPPPQAPPLLQAVGAFFDAIESEDTAHADLIAILYGAPPGQVRIVEQTLVSGAFSDDGDRALTVGSVLVHNTAGSSAIQRATYLYWVRDGEEWRLDADSSTVHALTENFLRAVREADTESAAAYIAPSRRSLAGGRLLVDRFGWMPDEPAVNRQFEDVRVEVAPDGRHATSWAVWVLLGAEGEKALVEIPWVKGEGSWWIDLPRG